MNVLLCIPPVYDCNFPPLGTPAILGFLKNKGVDAAQIDLNLAYRDFLATKIEGKGLTEDDKRSLLDWVVRSFFTLKLKGRYYSKFFPRRRGKVFSDLPYGNNSNSSFYFAERILSSKHLFRYLEDKENNTFYQFYRAENIIARFKKDKIGLVGISVTSSSQAIPALTLGLLIRKLLPGVHVDLGGQWVTLFREELKKRRDLFACFDSLIVFEGETALYKLVKALDKDKVKLPVLTNVITAKNQNPSIESSGEDLNALAVPDFSGLALNAYNDSREGINVTYETTRGCYWNKCVYCVDLPLPKPKYRVKRVDIVIKEIRELIRKHNVKKLTMGDPGMSPRQMSAIAQELIRKKIKIKWWTMARLDPGFNQKIFETARQAGLTKVNFGFESACDKVCDFLDKGNRSQVSARVIKDCSQAGIQVDLQTIIGLPGETYDNAMETVAFLIENKKYIDAVTFNIYYLSPSNYVYNEPRRYGIAYDKKNVLPFQFFIPFKNKLGMTQDQAQLLINVYYRLLPLASKSKSLGRVKNKRHIRKVVFSLCGERLTVKV